MFISFICDNLCSKSCCLINENLFILKAWPILYIRWYWRALPTVYTCRSYGKVAGRPRGFRDYSRDIYSNNFMNILLQRKMNQTQNTFTRQVVLEIDNTVVDYRFLSITAGVALLTNKHIQRSERFCVLLNRPRTIQAVLTVATPHFFSRVDQRWLSTTCQPHVQVNTEPVETSTSNQHLAV